MYATCLFCHASLGRNEVLELFPVGRRLAFDPEKGRLWVVCQRCERWNLSPLEERWEAIEECERRFGDTRLRVSTDNIGMARLREGLELVRVGRALRPEFAAWRYGDQFGRRRRRRLIRIGASVGVIGAGLAGVIAVGASTGVGLGGFGWWISKVIGSTYERMAHGDPDTVVVRLPLDSGGVLPVKRRHLGEIRLSTEGSTVPRSLHGTGEMLLRVPLPSGRQHRESYTFWGEAARQAAGAVLPAINAAGADRHQVADAVQVIEQGRGGPDQLLRASAARYAGHAIAQLPVPVRLALEMAAHEESERRAMEGELALLEAAWRQAEEIAAIADDLLVPAPVTEFLARNRRN